MKTRKPSYFVKREKVYNKKPTVYWVYVNGYPSPIRIEKKPAGWFACSLYHKTLRDAIIYAAYGV